jgi:hypothetical protein
MISHFPVRLYPEGARMPKTVEFTNFRPASSAKNETAIVFVDGFTGMKDYQGPFACHALARIAPLPFTSGI